MSDLATVAMALSAVLGAVVARSVPWWVVGALVIVALLSQQAFLACVATAFLVSMLAAGAVAGLDRPLPGRLTGSTATLLTDPERSAFGEVEANARVRGRHLRLQARGDAAAPLLASLAGERLRLSGEVRPLSPSSVAFLRPHHVAGRVRVEQVRRIDGGSRLVVVSNALRRTIERGAEGMSLADRSLLTGLAYGDDRSQPDGLVADLRGAGLAHLSAVSGQNVSFVLLLAAPVLRCWGLVGRSLGGAVVLFLFGVLTRWEPSVLRAVLLAMLTLSTAFMGRPVSALRAVALVTTAALVLDPFLVRSVGFGLSVSACAGMALLGELLTSLLPGRPWLRRSLGYTLAAQVGVAPLALWSFGSVPPMGLLTNLLAEPAAALVMSWGLVVGAVAGVLGAPWAGFLQVPTVVATTWIRLVAHVGAGMGVGPWGWWQCALTGVLGLPIVGLGVVRRRRLATRFEVDECCAACVPGEGRRPGLAEPERGFARGRPGGFPSRRPHRARAE